MTTAEENKNRHQSISSMKVSFFFPVLICLKSKKDSARLFSNWHKHTCILFLLFIFWKKEKKCAHLKTKLFILALRNMILDSSQNDVCACLQLFPWTTNKCLISSNLILCQKHLTNRNNRKLTLKSSNWHLRKTEEWKYHFFLFCFHTFYDFSGVYIMEIMLLTLKYMGGKWLY